ncbi:pyridoxamine kinase [Agathobaculum sp.]|uniref:pyridoxamine kinase n=1 Tax=Agathobaculum sp. TaxID=2048138 RepID=UPI002A825DEA|nr:pyridoxamine kinase [Agathobaculum sp.]MDY3617575.1 pyridoxamine kinase [Agathobaculum sp.]
MQKKVLALHDLSGFGRSSLVPIIAVLSAAGHQCVPLPTAVFSTHTAISGWVTTDLTPAMQGTIDQYDALGLRFEAVYAGFLGSADQIGCVQEAAKRLRAQGGLTLVDPVMGDNGVVYGTYTPEMCTRMRELCAIADIITPNTTEAAILLDRDPRDKPADEDEAWAWLRALRGRYGAQAVLTGLDFEPGRVGTGCLGETGGAVQLHSRVGCYYPGTGDLFASVMLGALLNGQTLECAAARAGEFVRDCIAYTAAQGTDPMHGVQFEKLLWRLAGNK